MRTNAGVRAAIYISGTAPSYPSLYHTVRYRWRARRSSVYNVADASTDFIYTLDRSKTICCPSFTPINIVHLSYATLVVTRPLEQGK